jgi:signal transduction histidine kinase
MTHSNAHKQRKKTPDSAEEQLRHLSSQIIAAQEIERKRIARALHDELGHDLSLMKFKVRFIEKNLFENQSNIKKECKDMLGFIDHVIENVRRLSRDLSPTVLDDLGLKAAIRWLIDNLETSERNLQVKSDITNIGHYVPRDSHINIYRVIQEALTNIREHASAKKVSIVIKKEDNTIFFSIEDDGKGFDVKQALRKITIERGLGLASMAERVQMLDGKFNLHSEKGKGTQISFTIPFKKKTRDAAL